MSVRLLCFNSANKKLKLHTTPCKIAKKQSTINTITAHRHRESAHEAPRNRDFGKFPISHPCPIAQIEALPPAQLFHTPHGTAPAEHKATASDAHVNDKHNNSQIEAGPEIAFPLRRSRGHALIWLLNPGYAGGDLGSAPPSPAALRSQPCKFLPHPLRRGGGLRRRVLSAAGLAPPPGGPHAHSPRAGLA